MTDGTKLRELIAKGRVLLDGGMGTELIRAGLKAGEISEEWLFTNPEAVKSVHRAYFEAGAQIVYTNSFGANAIKLKRTKLAGKSDEVNRRAVAVARAAAPGALVFGSMSTLGELLEPYGEMSENEARAAFREQAKALIEGGVDGVVVETHSDARELTISIEEARAAGAPAVIATMTFEGRNGKVHTIMGVTPEKAAETMIKAGADAVGANCGTVVDDMVEVISRMKAVAGDTPLVAKPNAGLPEHRNGDTVYPMSPEEFGILGAKLVERGARLVGGCCGTTPAHIRELKARTGK